MASVQSGVPFSHVFHAAISLTQTKTPAVDKHVEGELVLRGGTLHGLVKEGTLSPDGTGVAFQTLTVGVDHARLNSSSTSGGSTVTPVFSCSMHCDGFAPSKYVRPADVFALHRPGTKENTLEFVVTPGGVPSVDESPQATFVVDGRAVENVQQVDKYRDINLPLETVSGVTFVPEFLTIEDDAVPAKTFSLFTFISENLANITRKLGPEVDRCGLPYCDAAKITRRLDSPPGYMLPSEVADACLATIRTAVRPTAVPDIRLHVSTTLYDSHLQEAFKKDGFHLIIPITVSGVLYFPTGVPIPRASSVQFASREGGKKC